MSLITVHILYVPHICWQQSLRFLESKQTNEQRTVKRGKLLTLP